MIVWLAFCAVTLFSDLRRSVVVRVARLVVVHRARPGAARHQDRRRIPVPPLWTEHTPLTVIATSSPDEAVAVTLNVVLYVGLAGAFAVTEMV